MNIAVDAMGGNHAPSEIVKGAVAACKESEISIILVGDKKKISELIKDKEIENIRIYHSPEVIYMDEPPFEALRKKKMSSVRLAFELLKEGKADAVVSAGNSGAFIGAAILSIGLLDGIEKPAIATLIPTKRSYTVLIDSGANVDCKPFHLFQFGLLGHIFCSSFLGIKSPKIAVLSIGEEEGKGNKIVKSVYKIFQESPLNFIGNIEGNEIFSGDADVVVCDGFVGNISLKICEGLADFIMEWISEDVSERVLEKIKRKLDYEEYGGGIVLGINGIGIICHGRSTSKAIKNAIITAKDLLKKQVLKDMKMELKNILNSFGRKGYG